jgi:hypothetical protein
MAPEVVDVLPRVDGTARAADLIALCGRATLVRAVRSGTVVRVARGRYVLAICPDPWVSALRLAGVVSHRSAAQHWGLAVLNRPQVPDVTIGPHRHDVVTGAARLHWASLDGADVDRDLSVTTPLRTRGWTLATRRARSWPRRTASSITARGRRWRATAGAMTSSSRGAGGCFGTPGST